MGTKKWIEALTKPKKRGGGKRSENKNKKEINKKNKKEIKEREKEVPVHISQGERVV